MRSIFVWIFAGVIGALATHLAMVFLIPIVSSSDSTTLIRALGPANTLVVMPDGRPPNALSTFADATALYGYCPFDVRDATTRLAITVTRFPMSIVLLGKGGRVISTVSDKVATSGKLVVRIATATQITDLKDQDNPDDPSPDVRIPTPDLTGALVIKIFFGQESQRAEALTALRAIECTADPVP